MVTQNMLPICFFFKIVDYIYNLDFFCNFSAFIFISRENKITRSCPLRGVVCNVCVHGHKMWVGPLWFSAPRIWCKVNAMRLNTDSLPACTCDVVYIRHCPAIILRPMAAPLSQWTVRHTAGAHVCGPTCVHVDDSHRTCISRWR